MSQSFNYFLWVISNYTKQNKYLKVDTVNTKIYGIGDRVYCTSATGTVVAHNIETFFAIQEWG